MRTKTTLAVRLVTRVTRVTRVDSPKLCVTNPMVWALPPEKTEEQIKCVIDDNEIILLIFS